MEKNSGFTARCAGWSGESGVREFEYEGPHSRLEQDSLVWLALTVRDAAKARTELITTFGFHEIAAQEAVTETERPAWFFTDDTVFVTMPLIYLRDGLPDFAQLGIFVCSGLVVTVTTQPCAFVDEWLEKWKSKPAEIGPSGDRLMEQLVDATIDDYFPVLDRLQDDLDALEDGIYSGTKFDLSGALRLKRALLETRRQTAPIRETINALLRRDVALVRPETRTHLQDAYDHTLRVLDGIDLDRDILSTIMDAYLSVQSNRLNEVMRNMTSIATILMAMALIPGVYGMNFRHMPELEWKNGYYAALIWMVIVCVGGLALASKIGWLIVHWPWERPRTHEPKKPS